MERKLFIPDDVKETVKNHNVFSNDVVGVFAFSMGISSLASTNAISLASVSFFFCFIWMFYKGHQIYRELRRISKNTIWYDELLSVFSENLIFLIGFSLLGLIASGLVTINQFNNFSLKQIIEYILNT